MPLPAALGRPVRGGAWVSVIVLHEGARVVGGALDALRARAVRDLPPQPGQVAAQALHHPRHGAPGDERGRVREHPRAGVRRVAGRRHRGHRRPAGGRARGGGRGRRGARGAVRVRDPDVAAASTRACPRSGWPRRSGCWRGPRRWGRSTRAWRWPPRWCAAARSGQAIVAEARRRGVEAIVLAAEEPTPGPRRGASSAAAAGRATASSGRPRATWWRRPTCTVILTAPPAGPRTPFAKAFCRSAVCRQLLCRVASECSC